MLKIVGGTAFQNKDSTKSEKSASQSEQEQLARKIIMDFNLGQTTVRELIEKAGKTGAKPLDLSVFPRALITFNTIGIFLAPGGASIGIAQGAYATVIDEKLLKKAIPELKKFSVSLHGLALF